MTDSADLLGDDILSSYISFTCFSMTTGEELRSAHSKVTRSKKTVVSIKNTNKERNPEKKMNSSAINSTVISLTQLSLFSSNVNQFIKISFLTLTFLCFFFFLYFIIVILMVFFSNVYVRENPRYLLFAHMLITDTIYLSLGIFLSVSVMFLPVSIPVPVCYIVIIMITTTFKVTPYNLAAMALERYMAICFPLRHGQLCTRPRSLVVIGVIWIIGFVPSIADFIILISSKDPSFFSLRLMCTQYSFMNTPQQNAIQITAYVLCFAVVGLIIIYTYIRIMLIAMKLDSGNSSASKAGKTVMLHALQLLLCMTAFSHNITELFFQEYILLVARINFLFFMCLPRSLSPLIYGLRDEMLCSYIKKFVLCKPLKVVINAT
ncbi:odorant receptor 131-2-like [Pelobates fuscus]|uniref:odorant receptor 131-2-like n=1 Tax=Pelobates fuscus TaxID=191477 RepID=UPI002FE4E708